MSKFELNDLGEGHFALNGEMTFETAERILLASDSAGLALLLEWITWANHTVREIRFLSMPERVLAIARTTEVEQLLRRGERWAGFIEAPGS
jgi:hypothetical protein